MIYLFKLLELIYNYSMSLEKLSEPDQGELNYPWLLNKFRQLCYSGLFGAEYRPRAADAEHPSRTGYKMVEGIQNSIPPLSFQFP